MNHRMLTIEEAAVLSNTGEGTIRAAMKRGELRSEKIGKYRRFDEGEVRRWAGLREGESGRA